jgi:hypothetical protein
MHRLSRAVIATLGGIIVTTAFASTAKAGCLDLPSLISGPRMGVSALYLPGHGGAVSAQNQQGDEGATIVGMWQFEFISQGNSMAPPFIPDGALLDAGYAQWHSDGTEIMNSGRDPATSSFCLGVWKNVNGGSYKLNHFALSWDNTGKFCTPQAGAPSCFVGPANIREEIVLDRRGNSYTGSVTIDQYDPDNHWQFRLTANVSAQRLTAD